MQIWKAQLLHKTNLILGEGTHWHNGWKKFLYVDIIGKKVGCIDPVNNKLIEKKVTGLIGCVVSATNGNLIMALQGAIVEINFETAETKQLCEIEKDKPNNRCNDGKCDAAGRLWVGTMHTDAKKKQGALYCFDGMLQKKIKSTSVSNGICWNAGNDKMYYIDSLDYNIKMFDFDLATGNISNEKIIVTIETPGFLPDGMTIDAAGMLWVAMWGGGCVHRYNPADGTLIGKVSVDAINVTNCAFGGENMQHLLITTAREGLNREQLKQSPLSGSLFIVDTGIKGSASHFFNN